MSPPRPARNYRGLIKIAVAVIIVIGVLATLSWQWPRIAGVFHSVDPDRRTAAGGAEPRSCLAAEILRSRAAGRREPGARGTSGKPGSAGGGAASGPL